MNAFDLYVRIRAALNAERKNAGHNRDIADVQSVEHGAVATIIVVADADEAHSYLTARDVDCSPVQDLDWGRFVNFSDPDGNLWALQQLPARG